MTSMMDDVDIQEMGIWLFKVMLIFVTFLVIAGPVRDYAREQLINTHKLDSRLVVERAAGLLSFEDEYSGRVMNNVIARENFNSEVLEKGFIEKNHFSLNVRLEDFSGNKLIDDIYYDKDYYDKFEPLSWDSRFNKLEEVRLVRFEGENARLIITAVYKK